eukprot:PhF_6_TR38598/c2_g2_i5/m.57423
MIVFWYFLLQYVVIVVEPLTTGYAQFVAGPGATSCSSGGDGLVVSSSTCFRTPTGVTYNSIRDELYVAEYGAHRVRSIPLSTMVISTLAGSSTGTSGNQANVVFSATRLNGPRGLRVLDTNIYICDTMNNEIKLLNLATMRSEYYAGAGRGDDTNMVAGNALLYRPSYLDIYKNRLYFSDHSNGKMKRITLLDTYLTTVTSLSTLQGIAIYKGSIYMNQLTLYDVNKIPIVGGTVTKILGQGVSGDSNTAGNELFMGIAAVYTDCLRKTLMIHDYTADKAKRYSFSTQRVTTYFGAGSFTSYNGPGPRTATTYMIDGPYGGAINGIGEEYVVTSVENRITKVGLSSTGSTSCDATATVQVIKKKTRTKSKRTREKSRSRVGLSRTAEQSNSIRNTNTLPYDATRTSSNTKDIRSRSLQSDTARVIKGTLTVSTTSDRSQPKVSSKTASDRMRSLTYSPTMESVYIPRSHSISFKPSRSVTMSHDRTQTGGRKSKSKTRHTGTRIIRRNSISITPSKDRTPSPRWNSHTKSSTASKKFLRTMTLSTTKDDTPTWASSNTKERSVTFRKSKSPSKDPSRTFQLNVSLSQRYTATKSQPDGMTMTPSWTKDKSLPTKRVSRTPRSRSFTGRGELRTRMSVSGSRDDTPTLVVSRTKSRGLTMTRIVWDTNTLSNTRDRTASIVMRSRTRTMRTGTKVVYRQTRTLSGSVAERSMSVNVRSRSKSRGGFTETVAGGKTATPSRGTSEHTPTMNKRSRSVSKGYTETVYRARTHTSSQTSERSMSIGKRSSTRSKGKSDSREVVTKTLSPSHTRVPHHTHTVSARDGIDGTDEVTLQSKTSTVMTPYVSNTATVVPRTPSVSLSNDMLSIPINHTQSFNYTKDVMSKDELTQTASNTKRI